MNRDIPIGSVWFGNSISLNNPTKTTKKCLRYDSLMTRAMNQLLGERSRWFLFLEQGGERTYWSNKYLRKTKHKRIK